MGIDLEKVTCKVCQLAKEVGQFQRQQRLTFDINVVESKRSHDYVSYVDKESEQMIVSALRQIVPEAGFITEEKTTTQTSATQEYTWIVDPLDGTTNYIHDLGPWAVCIALRHAGRLIIGVAYEVARDELFYAWADGGAWLSRSGSVPERMHASITSDIDQALVMIGYPYNADGFRDFAARISSRLYGHCASLRSMGSAEAELCYVAAGRIDVYFESFLSPWDVAAGAIIVMEAGGRVSDYCGSDKDWPSGRQMLATNNLLHSPMLKLINETLVK